MKKSNDHIIKQVADKNGVSEKDVRILVNLQNEIVFNDMRLKRDVIRIPYFGKFIYRTKFIEFLKNRKNV